MTRWGLPKPLQRRGCPTHRCDVEHQLFLLVCCWATPSGSGDTTVYVLPASLALQVDTGLRRDDCAAVMIRCVGYGGIGAPASLYVIYVFPFVLNWFGRAYFVIFALVAGIFDRFGGGVQDGMRCRFTLITGVSVRFCLFTEILQCAAPLWKTAVSEALYCRFETGCCAAPLWKTAVAGVLYCRFEASCCAAP